jgi:hypothetical protein
VVLFQADTTFGGKEAHASLEADTTFGGKEAHASLEADARQVRWGQIDMGRFVQHGLTNFCHGARLPPLRLHFFRCPRIS